LKVWRYGDNVNTDQLFPGKYTYTCFTPDEIKLHLFEDLDPSFVKNVKSGDLIFGGKNFGCGSSREQPVVGLKAVGIKAVVAKSFARIFYRSAINQGLLLVECPDAVDAYSDKSMVKLDVNSGLIIVDGKKFCFPRLPKEIIAIRDAGGLLNYTRSRLKAKKKN
jgi:3-isopropylmalate/(R)-2-methylmalate dehydratase small subunit